MPAPAPDTRFKFFLLGWGRTISKRNLQYKIDYRCCIFEVSVTLLGSVASSQNGFGLKNEVLGHEGIYLRMEVTTLHQTKKERV